MEEQNYAKHTMWVPLYHFVVPPFLLFALGGSIYNLIRANNNGSGRLAAAILVALSFVAAVVFYYARTFPLVAQDRVIRTEENLRHFVMTGKLLDRRLSVKQIIALRFASDGEFVALAQKAADSGMSPSDIKAAVKSWRADNARM